MPASRHYRDLITRTLGIDARTVRQQGQTCRLCGGFARPFDSLEFYKYCSPTDCFGFGFAGIHVEYRRCEDCGFVFTSFFDDWTPQDLAYNEDYPRVDFECADIRPGNVAALLAGRLALWRDIDMLDYGSGALAARMGEHGFAKITNYDPFSSPARPEGKFSLITCFEVIEHTVSPAVCLNDMASFLAPALHAARQLVVYRPAQRTCLDLHRRCARPARRCQRAGVPPRRLAARHGAGGRH
jgi:hypothetical protein